MLEIVLSTSYTLAPSILSRVSGGKNDVQKLKGEINAAELADVLELSGLCNVKALSSPPCCPHLDTPAIH